MDINFNNSVTLRFDEYGHAYVFAPYKARFIIDLKNAFNTPYDHGAEWNKILNCWIIYTGWDDCEHWIATLIELLNKHYPQI